MNFPRQWFAPGQQIGLRSSSQAFERALREKKWKLAAEIARKNGSEDKTYWKRQYYRLVRCIEKKDKYIRIGFINFWPDFSTKENQIIDMCRMALVNENVSVLSCSELEKCDVIFTSCYGSLKYNGIKTGATIILFLGENVRPLFRDYDYAISFDKSYYGGRNIHMPLWMLEIDYFGKKYQDRKPFEIKRFTTPRLMKYSDRRNRVVFVGNNEVPWRVHLIEELMSSGITVDCYGSQTKPVKDKNELYNSYKVAIAPENSYHPGYVTEKAIHGIVAPIHTIYSGGLTDEFFKDDPLLIKIDTYFRITVLVKKINDIFAIKEEKIFRPIGDEKDIKETIGKVAKQIKNTFQCLM